MKMLTFETYYETLKSVKSIVTDEEYALIKDTLGAQVFPYKVGDLITTPRGEFKIKAIDDNGCVENSFVETESENELITHIFKMSDCGRI